tara:strand:+ start:5 stop:499 length:495 start_codon:yes stop_codon:yes gene_type:complete
VSTFHDLFDAEVNLQNLDVILENLSKYKYTNYTSVFPLNCFLYIAYPLQWIHGRDALDLSPLPRLPVDAPLTNPESCSDAFKKLFGRNGYWPGVMLYENFKSVLPGDIIIASVNKVPGHMMICGGQQKIWHSNPSGVKVHNLDVISKQKAVWHYRPSACSKISK